MTKKTEPKIDSKLVSSTLLDYYNLKEQISELESRLETAKVGVINALKATDGQKVELPGLAKFSLRRTIAYKYSTDVELLEADVKRQQEEFAESIAEDVENIKALKKQEEKDGTAKEVKESEKFTPVVTPVKE